MPERGRSRVELMIGGIAIIWKFELIVIRWYSWNNGFHQALLPHSPAHFVICPGPLTLQPLPTCDWPLTVFGLIFLPEEAAIRMSIGKHKHAEKNLVSLNFIFRPEQTFETVDHENSVPFHGLQNARPNVILDNCRHVMTVIWNEMIILSSDCNLKWKKLF